LRGARPWRGASATRFAATETTDPQRRCSREEGKRGSNGRPAVPPEGQGPAVSQGPGGWTTSIRGAGPTIEARAIPPGAPASDPNLCRGTLQWPGGPFPRRIPTLGCAGSCTIRARPSQRDTRAGPARSRYRLLQLVVWPLPFGKKPGLHRSGAQRELGGGFRPEGHSGVEDTVLRAGGQRDLTFCSLRHGGGDEKRGDLGRGRGCGRAGTELVSSVRTASRSKIAFLVRRAAPWTHITGMWKLSSWRPSTRIGSGSPAPRFPWGGGTFRGSLGGIRPMVRPPSQWALLVAFQLGNSDHDEFATALNGPAFPRSILFVRGVAAQKRS